MSPGPREGSIIARTGKCIHSSIRFGVWLMVFLWCKKWSESKASYINFCETSIQCIHTTVDHLNESDQRRPTDRPYTNGYFLDLVEQVRQYAAEMAASRASAGSSASNEVTHEQ